MVYCSDKRLHISISAIASARLLSLHFIADKSLAEAIAIKDVCDKSLLLSHTSFIVKDVCHYKDVFISISNTHTFFYLHI